MKPDLWVIEDIRALRSKELKTPQDEEYLKLLLSYVKMISKL